MNWFDWTVVGMLAISVIAGYRDGFVRLGIGFAALITGFLLASWFHGSLAGSFQQWIDSDALARLIAFLLILFGTLILGGIAGNLLSRALGLVGLSFFDRVAGAAFGLVRGAFVLVVVFMVVMAFAPGGLPPLRNSTLAPYLVRASRAMTSMTPYQLRNGFHRTYDKLEGVLKDLRPEKLNVRQE